MADLYAIHFSKSVSFLQMRYTPPLSDPIASLDLQITPPLAAFDEKIEIPGVTVGYSNRFPDNC
jgi:hypothetical protein